MGLLIHLAYHAIFLCIRSAIQENLAHLLSFWIHMGRFQDRKIRIPAFVYIAKPSSGRIRHLARSDTGLPT